MPGFPSRNLLALHTTDYFMYAYVQYFLWYYTDSKKNKELPLKLFQCKIMVLSHLDEFLFLDLLVLFGKLVLRCKYYRSIRFMFVASYLLLTSRFYNGCRCKNYALHVMVHKLVNVT